MSASLTYFTALSRTDLLAPPVEAALRALPWADQVQVTEIDPTLSDTAQFCAAYGITLEESVNCVVIVAKRGADVTYAACMIAAPAFRNFGWRFWSGGPARNSRLPMSSTSAK